MKSNNNEITVVLADMEKLRIIKLSPRGTKTEPHAKPVTMMEMDFPKKRHYLSGRFPQGRSVSQTAGMSPGEDHDVKSEYKKRRIELIARKITEFLMRGETRAWSFAAPVSISSHILTLIPPSLKSSMISNFNSDLTHLELAEIEKRFLGRARKI